jgi:hypothetical protein
MNSLPQTHPAKNFDSLNNILRNGGHHYIKGGCACGKIRY